MKVLFFSPHPDDIEFACGSTEIQLIEKGHDVIMACFTAGEYGIERNDFKGERLSRIRRWELRQATKAAGVSKLYWLGYIDGYSRFDKGTIDRLEKFLLRINPDVIFAPDPIFPVDSHVDHLNLAKTVFHIWHRLKKKPLYCLYYTYQPNYYVLARNRKKVEVIYKKFLSQGFAGPFSFHLSYLVKLIFGFFSPHAFFSETYRLPTLELSVKYKNPIRMPNLVYKLLSNLFKKSRFAVMPERDRFLPSPEELGLKECRFNIDF